jgi:hypothetical protein
VIVIVHPLLGLRWVDKGEGQGPNTEPRGKLNRLAVGASNPDWRMRLLQRLRYDIAAGHGEKLTLVPWYRP